MKKVTVTIGIPALNEEANIVRLLIALLEQQQRLYIITKIIVVDDGSTDNTVSSINALRNKKIILRENKERKGIVASQNIIIKETKDDVLVMLDADVLPKDKNFIENMIKPIMNGQADLVGASTVPVRSKGFTEHVLATSHVFKQTLYQAISDNNIYLCHGRGRAFSKSFYSKLRWVENVPEDAYSYLFCISKGYQFKYEKNAEIVFRCPTSIKEHAKQRLRFLDGRNALINIFGVTVIEHAFRIPLFVLLKTTMLFYFAFPVEMISFMIINFYTRYFLSIGTINHSKHQVATSSKNLLI